MKRLVRLEVERTVLDLHEDVRAETQQLFPESTWSWEADWQVERLVADRRLVQQGVVQLLRAACGAGQATWLIRMQTAERADRIEWIIAAQRQGNTTVAPLPPEAMLVEQRLALALAFEYLAATDIACCPVDDSTTGAAAFSLMIPHRLPHG